MLAVDEITIDAEGIAKGLDEGEGVFNGLTSQLLRRYLTGLTAVAVENGRYGLPLLVESEIRQAARLLGKLMRGLGRLHASRELSLRLKFAAAPESPSEADELLNGFLGEIESEARAIVNRVIENGGDVREAMRALSEEFPSWAKAKQERIARTIAAFHFNRGRMDVFREAGIGAFKISAILDSRICSICFGAAGLVISIDAGLSVWPPLHFSCRCLVQPMIDYDGPMIRTMQELHAAASRNLREAAFMIGKKLITDWPGVPPGWGQMPPGVAARVLPPVEVPAPIPTEALRDNSLLNAVVSAAAIGAGLSAAARAANYREAKRLVNANPDVFPQGVDALIREIAELYTLSTGDALTVAVAYIIETLRLGGRA